MRGSFILFAVVLVLSCSEGKNEQQERESIKSVLEAQRAAWNSGDIDEYMKGYWNSDSLSFISGRGVNRGWENTLKSYRKGYPDKKSMGYLTFEVLELKRLSGEYYYMIGSWNLERETDNPNGYFTLLWRKFENGWRIISDHTS